MYLLGRQVYERIKKKEKTQQKKEGEVDLEEKVEEIEA
jgi:hypothetical protein